MDALARLVSFYNSCTLDDTYRLIAHNVLQNIDALPKSSSYQMADLCFTAPSTLRRLATKIGYKSYTAFKADMNWSLENYRFLNVYRNLNIEQQCDPVAALLNYIADIANFIRDSIDYPYLNEVVTDLRNYKRIVFFVSSTTFQIQRLETDLLLDGHEVMLYTDLHDQMSQSNMLDQSCFAIFIKPEVPVTGNVRKLAQMAKTKGARTLIVSNNNSYRPNDFIDYALNFVGTASLIDLFAIDMLVAAIVVKHQELLAKAENA